MLHELPENEARRTIDVTQFSEVEVVRFIDLTDGRGWAELESALPEGSVDDLVGRPV